MIREKWSKQLRPTFIICTTSCWRLLEMSTTYWPWPFQKDITRFRLQLNARKRQSSWLGSKSTNLSGCLWFERHPFLFLMAHRHHPVWHARVCAAYIDNTVIFSTSWKTIWCPWLPSSAAEKKQVSDWKAIMLIPGTQCGKREDCTTTSPSWCCAKIQTTRTKKDVRAFLGLAGYYRRFIPNFSGISTPISDLTKKLVPNTVQWAPECGQTFASLKNKLSHQPLTTPDCYKVFILQTDASEKGIGAILSQPEDNGRDQPVARSC